MLRIEEEILDLASDDVDELIDYAADQLRIVTPVDTGEARLGWGVKHSKNLGQSIATGELINDVEHIGPLNNGHSKQAPPFFIESVLSTIGLITKD